MSNPATCHHCRERPAAGDLGLCERCNAMPNVRLLYRPVRDRPPGWAERLERMAEKAKRREPLFD